MCSNTFLSDESLFTWLPLMSLHIYSNYNYNYNGNIFEYLVLDSELSTCYVSGENEVNYNSRVHGKSWYCYRNNFGPVHQLPNKACRMSSASKNPRNSVKDKDTVKSSTQGVHNTYNIPYTLAI